MSDWEEVKQAFEDLVKTHRQLCDTKRLAKMSKHFLRDTERHNKKRDALNEKIKKHNDKYGTKFPLAR